MVSSSITLDRWRLGRIGEVFHARTVDMKSKIVEP